MSELVDTWRSPRTISFVAITAVTYVVISLLISSTITSFGSGFSPRIAVGGVLVFSLLFGPAAAWGSALGFLGTEIVYGSLGFSSVFGAIGHFLLAYLAYNLWGNLGLLSSGSEPTMRSRRQANEFVLVAFISSSALIAITAWGYEILGTLPYFITVTDSFTDFFLPAVLIGLALLYFLYPRLEAKGLTYRGVSASDPSMWRVHTTSLILVSWLLLGTVISIGYQIYQRIPYHSFVRRDLESVRALAEIALGPTGGRVQAVLGSILFTSLLMVLLYHGGFGRADRMAGDQ